MEAAKDMRMSPVQTCASPDPRDAHLRTSDVRISERRTCASLNARHAHLLSGLLRIILID